MRALLAASFAVIAVGLSTGAGSGKDDKKPAPKLEGTYLIVGMEMSGEKIPAEFVTKAPEADRTIVIKDGKLIATKGGKEDTVAYKVDNSKTPAEITTTETKPGGKTETSYGIYKIDGDTLTICMVESSDAKDRPKEFKTEKGSKTMIIVLKKKDK
jgi:uncharacterized protein (TIGR03067 family)